MGHWYTQTGESCHEVTGKNGKLRATSISDAKRLALYPSVTTIFDDVLAKKALQTWRDRQITFAAFMTQPKALETDEAYHARIMGDAFKQVDDAADLGTRIHKALELHFDGKPYDEQLSGYVQAVDKWVMENKIEFVSKELRLVNRSYGYAGTTDVEFRAPGKFGIGDYKTRKTKPGMTCEPWETQPMQIAAYHQARFGSIEGDEACGFNLYISTTEPGRVEAVWYDCSKLQREWEAFTHALALWKHFKGWDPAQTK